MKTNFKLYYFFFLVSSLCYLFPFLNSCRKEITPSWDVDLLAPLVKSTLTVNNIIPDSLLQQNPDNSLDIVYTTSLYTFSAVAIPDTTIDTIYTSNPFTIPFPPGQYFVNPANQQQKFPIPNGVQLTRVDLRSGELVIVARNRVEEMIRVRYQIPSATLGGVPFDKIFDVPAQTGGGCPGTPSVFTATYDMSGYVLDFTGTSGNGYNTLVTNLSAQINPAALTSVTVTPCDSIYISNSFIDMVPSYAKGYFGNSVITAGPDSTDFSLFNHIIDGTLNLEDIDIDFSIENSIGADARITIDNLSSVNTRTGNTIQLAHSIIGSPVNLNRAVDNNGNVTSSVFSVSFNPSNSNIKSFVENLPDKMSYQLDLEINPLGNVSGTNDFVYYDKLMKTEMNMIVPLSLVANNLTLADTVDFDMDESTNSVNHGTLYLYAENGFPFTAEAQLYLMDDNFAIVDSLISAPAVILAPQLDANLICAGKLLTKLTIPLDKDKMQLLRDTKNMYIKMKYNTAGQPSYVKIYSFYEMNVKLVGDFNYTIGKKE